MAIQREKPGCSVAELEAVLGIPHSVENRMSGGQIENFREGWAKDCNGQGDKAHYFKRTTFDRALSLCQLDAPVRWLFGRGNFPHCQTCLRYTRRRLVVNG